jgi:multidrug efflux pump subunit AcrB
VRWVTQKNLYVPEEQRGSSRADSAASAACTFQGTARAFQQSLAHQRLLIAAALLAVYTVLGVLYESYVHPIRILATLPRPGSARRWR